MYFAQLAILSWTATVSCSVPMAMPLQKMAATVSCVMDHADRVCALNQALYSYIGGSSLGAQGACAHPHPPPAPFNLPYIIQGTSQLPALNGEIGEPGR